MTADPSAIRAEHLRTLRGIHAATKADLCACGVPVGNCNTHKARTDDEQQESA